MKRFTRSAAAILLAVAMIVTYTPLFGSTSVFAEEEDAGLRNVEYSDVSIEDGYLQWSEQPGAYGYRVGVYSDEDDIHSWFVSAEDTEELRRYDIHTLIDYLITDNRIDKNDTGYGVLLEVIDEDYNTIDEWKYDGRYAYDSPAEPVQVGVIENAAFDASTCMLSWDAFVNGDDPPEYYQYEIAYNGGTTAPVVYDSTTVSIRKKLNELYQEGTIVEGEPLTITIHAQYTMESEDNNYGVTIAKSEPIEYEYTYTPLPVGTIEASFDPETRVLSWEPFEDGDYPVTYYMYTVNFDATGGYGDYSTGFGFNVDANRSSVRAAKSIEEMCRYYNEDYTPGTTQIEPGDELRITVFAFYRENPDATWDKGTLLAQSDPIVYYYDPFVPATIEGVTVNDGEFLWPEVDGAEYYIPAINGIDLEKTSDNYVASITDRIDFMIRNNVINKGDTYRLSVQAYDEENFMIAEGEYMFPYASEAEPVAVGEIEGFAEDDGMLTWTPYETEYGEVTNYHIDVIDDNDNDYEYDTQGAAQVDLDLLFAEMVDAERFLEEGESLQLTITALDQDGVRLAAGTYTATYREWQVGELEAELNEEEGTLTFSQVPGVDHYTLGIDYEYTTLHNEVGEINLNNLIDKWTRGGYIPAQSYHYIRLEANDSRGRVISRYINDEYYHYPDDSGEDPETGDITGVSLSDDGVLSWDVYSGADRYIIWIDEGNVDGWNNYYYVPEGETSQDLHAVIDKLLLDDEVDNTGHHTYRLTAVKADDQGTVLAQYFGEFDYTTPNVPVPTALDAKIENNILTWEDVTGAERYKLYIESDGASDTVFITSPFNLGEKLDDLGIPAGDSSYDVVNLKLTAYNADGYKLASWKGDCIWPEPTVLTAPLALDTLTATFTAGQPVEWTYNYGDYDDFCIDHETWTNVDDPSDVLSSDDEIAIPQDGATYRHSVVLVTADGYVFPEDLQIRYGGQVFTKDNGLTVQNDYHNMVVTIGGLIPDITVVPETRNIAECDVAIDNALIDPDAILQYKYDGEAHPMAVAVRDEDTQLAFNKDFTCSITDDSGAAVDRAVNAGRYWIKICGKGKYTGETTIQMRISPQVVAVPAAKTGLTYNGAAQTGIASGSNYTRSGYSKTNAGTYTATVSLKDPSNYVWPDGTSESKKIKWTISPKSLSVAATKTTVGSISTQWCTGSQIKPTPTVKATVNGKVITLKRSTDGKTGDYKLTYKSNKLPGTATVTITGINNYKGTKSKSFTIKVRPTTLSSVTGSSKAFTAKWTARSSKNCTGYQIQYSTSATFAKGNKTATVSKYSTASKKVSKLTSGKKYYVRIRTYKTINGVKKYSAWSAKKYVKVK